MADESIRALFPHCLSGMFSRMRVVSRRILLFFQLLGWPSWPRLHAAFARVRTSRGSGGWMLLCPQVTFHNPVARLLKFLIVFICRIP